MTEINDNLRLNDQEPEWEYTYMRPDTGYPDDFAGLPADRETAEEMAASFPGEGQLLKRVVAGPWVPVDEQTTTATNDDLRLPPDTAWIELRTDIITATEQLNQHSTAPGQRTTRMTGTLTGAWPRHGRVRRLPSPDRDITITEATLHVLPDGSIRAE